MLVFASLKLLQIKKFHGITFFSGRQNKFSKVSSAMVAWKHIIKTSVITVSCGTNNISTLKPNMKVTLYI